MMAHQQDTLRMLCELHAQSAELLPKEWSISVAFRDGGRAWICFHRNTLNKQVSLKFSLVAVEKGKNCDSKSQSALSL